MYYLRAVVSNIKNRFATFIENELWQGLAEVFCFNFLLDLLFPRNFNDPIILKYAFYCTNSSQYLKLPNI